LCLRAVFNYEGNRIVTKSIGTDFEEFRANFSGKNTANIKPIRNNNHVFTLLEEEERVFGYLRMFTGDELSRRAKFVLLTWSGNGVNAIKRARMSIDKGLLKEAINVSYALKSSNLG
jgi:hypothetical protein